MMMMFGMANIGSAILSLPKVVLSHHTTTTALHGPTTIKGYMGQLHSLFQFFLVFNMVLIIWILLQYKRTLFVE